MSESATTATATLAAPTLQMGWINRANLYYGAVGVSLLAQFGAGTSWRSFLAGWVIAVFNFELLRRLGSMLAATYDGSGVGALFYFVLFGKFTIWGLIIALIASASWLQGLPFLAGTATILIASVGLVTKELIHAR